MKRSVVLLLSVLVSAMSAACSGGGGGGGSGTGGSSASFTGVVFTEGGKVGWPLDGDGSTPIMASFADDSAAFDADANGVWMATSTPKIYGMNTDGSNLRGPFDVPASSVGLDFATIAGTEVWFANSGSNAGPVVFDTVAETAADLPPDPDFGGSFDGIDSDDSSVYVLHGISFGLVKYSRATRARELGVALGENPADPTGPRGAFAGNGELGVGSGFVWVFDTSVYKLHKIAKADLSITQTVDLNALILPAADSKNMNMVVGDTRVYIANRDPGDDTGVILAVDKASGTASSVWTMPDSIIPALGIKGDTLLVSDGIGTLAVDGLTGTEHGRVPAELHGDPTVWVP